MRHCAALIIYHRLYLCPSTMPPSGTRQTNRLKSGLKAQQAEGEPRRAKALNEDAIGRRRRVLGEDHPDTLSSAYNLAIVLSQLGDATAARALDEDTLGRRRRVLGEDHPDTLSSAYNLADDLYA
jgi:hypothetical protein